MMSRFSSRASNMSSSNATEIEEIESAPIDANVDVVEDKIFIAVGKEFKESKNTLLWAFQNFGMRAVVLVHVHCPDKYISMMGGKFSVSQLTSEQVNAHRQIERKRMHKNLDKYLLYFNSAKIQAEKLVIEMDDVARGLIELITQHQITRLVMGAAADKKYSANMKVPKSKKAIIVNNEAPSSCKIWFICKGVVICFRESVQPINDKGQAPNVRPTPSMRSSSFELSQSKSMPKSIELTNPVQKFVKNMFRSSSANVSESFARLRSNVSDTCEGISGSSVKSYTSSWSGGDDVDSNVGSSLMLKDDDSPDGSVISYAVHNSPAMSSSVQTEPAEDHLLSTNDQQDDLGADDEMYNKLRQALTEVDDLKHQAYKELCKRSTAEREAMEARQRAKNLELKCAHMIKEKEELKESVARLTMEMGSLKTEQDEAHRELESALELKLQLGMQLDSYSSSVQNLEEKLSSSQQLLSSIESERDALQRERDNLIKVAEELHQKIELNNNAQPLPNFLEFSFSELEEATQEFKDSQKIGEGGYGSVYRGFLRHTTVAIKVLRSHNWQGLSEFHQEIEILSKMRHPNLVTLIGACSEKRAVVHEYLPNGSLEDHLSCANNASPLSWQARVRIAAEICSALIFLHSSKPQSVVHGDLKPDNILLDANLTSKLSDFGISRLLTESASTQTLYCRTGPKGTLVYMDPEFLLTGELTVQSDVYSFGVVLLRILTAKPPFGIVREVKDALDKGLLQGILDPSAGKWPFVQAQQLAELGLRCCEMSRKSRPDLVREVWRVIAPMMRPLLKAASSFSIGPTVEDNSLVPHYFICPIFQEIMRDPHIASDGYTYEAEAIKGWIENHKTSPMTNLELPSDLLIPNLALRSAIKEWSQQHENP